METLLLVCFVIKTFPIFKSGMQTCRLHRDTSIADFLKVIETASQLAAYWESSYSAVLEAG